MANQKDSDNPASNTKEDSLSQTPVSPATPEKREVRDKGKTNSQGKEDVSRELAREFRWVEAAQIGSNVVLAIVGIIALCIYAGQLSEMRKSTQATQIAAEAAMESADLTRKQMEGISAAIVEFKQAAPLVRVDPPPIGGEVRCSFTNTGHVIAHNIYVEFTATVNNMTQRFRSSFGAKMQNWRY